MIHLILSPTAILHKESDYNFFCDVSDFVSISNLYQINFATEVYVFFGIFENEWILFFRRFPRYWLILGNVTVLGPLRECFLFRYLGIWLKVFHTGFDHGIETRESKLMLPTKHSVTSDVSTKKTLQYCLVSTYRKREIGMFDWHSNDKFTAHKAKRRNLLSQNLIETEIFQKNPYHSFHS